MHSHGLANDEAIGDQFSDCLTGIGIGDFVDLVGIEPDFALAATDDRSRQALLSAEIDPVGICVSNAFPFNRWIENVMSLRSK